MRSSTSQKGKNHMKKIHVVAAVIVSEGEILCMQRGSEKYDYLSYKFEFPGGKVEPGENRSDALSRELEEELGLDVDVSEDDFFMTVSHMYPDFEISMDSFVCRVSSRQFEKNVHHDHRWMKREDLRELDWAPADMPIVDNLMAEGLVI
jgi:8-oxo-dGTP diphosphatase